MTELEILKNAKYGVVSLILSESLKIQKEIESYKNIFSCNYTIFIEHGKAIALLSKELEEIERKITQLQ